jgi:hypothetical protein
VGVHRDVEAHVEDRGGERGARVGHRGARHGGVACGGVPRVAGEGSMHWVGHNKISFSLGQMRGLASPFLFLVPEGRVGQTLFVVAK